jgi:anti-sigma factor RsiW
MLDAYVDGELSADQMAQAQEHLQRCTICRDEIASLQSLKESLEQSRGVPEPPIGYWEDSRERITAKTTLSAEPLHQSAPPERQSYYPLLRSVLSVAASIALLVTVLVIGSKHEKPAVVIKGPSGQVIVAQALADELLIPDGGELTIGDQRRIGTACILAGGPGMLGRFNNLPGLLRVY